MRGSKRDMTDEEIIKYFIPIIRRIIAEECRYIKVLKVRMTAHSEDLKMLRAGKIPEKYKGQRTRA